MHEPQHTALFYDCRPMKAAALHVIDRVEAGAMTRREAMAELHALAASVPDLDPTFFAVSVGRLLDFSGYESARRVVNALSDRTFKTWARWLAAATVALMVAVVFVGLVAFAVWLVV